PPRLTTINPDYTVNKERPFEIHADVWPHLRRLLEEAEEDGVDLRVASSFRSFGTQSSLKSAYVTTYGAGTANRFSADQGYSEHQLGTTVDFSTSKLGGDFSKFETTPAYAWLTKEAHKYGFVLSYPKNNAYYQHEPWHWRFVGIDLARKLQEEGKHFYDLDQRELDSYLVKIFD
ncbi:MAG TPA: M15 family metallopeptidase, partial [Candidatus Paceibacterota bacterium]|nr:M15 family metallopeptidase [Candidatus Paceibacterota bacterium]